MTAETTADQKIQGVELLRYLDRAVPVFIWISPVLAGLLSLHMGKSMAWDLLHYHYYNGYAFLNGRLNFDILPAVFHTFLNPALDVAFYMAVEALPPRAVGFGLGAIHGVNIVLLFLCARRMLAHWGGMAGQAPNLLPAFLAVSGFGSAAAMGTLGSWHHDLIASLFFLGALLVLLRRRGRRQALAGGGAGLLVGLGLGLKLTLAPFVVAIVAAPLALPGPLRDRLLACVLAGAGAGVGLLATAGFWMARMYAEFGNPFFPFFNRLFASPFAGAGDGRDLRYLPVSLWEYLVYPVVFSFDGDRVSEAPWRDFRLLTAFTVAVCLVAVVVGSRLGRKAEQGRTAASGPAMPGCCCGRRSSATPGWLVLFSIYRYAVPLEMLVPLLLCVMLVALAGRRFGIVATVVCCLLLVATTQKADFARKDWGDDPFVGAEAPAAYKGLRDAVILMAGRSADAHFIPAFDPSNRFLRLDGFDYVYRADDPFTRRAAGIVAGHTGRCWRCSAATGAGRGPKTPSAPSALRSTMRPVLRWNPGSGRPSRHSCAGSGRCQAVSGAGRSAASTGCRAPDRAPACPARAAAGGSPSGLPRRFGLRSVL